MTCTNIWCGYEFCWICNGKYEESHYKNPISMCFGLADSDKDKILLKYSFAKKGIDKQTSAKRLRSSSENFSKGIDFK